MVSEQKITELLSIPEVSEILGISRALCRGLVKAGTIKSVMIGKRHKIRRGDLEEYIGKNTYEPIRVFQSRPRRRKGC